mgnify:CR=1 FL=1
MKIFIVKILCMVCLGLHYFNVIRFDVSIVVIALAGIMAFTFYMVNDFLNDFIPSGKKLMWISGTSLTENEFYTFIATFLIVGLEGLVAVLVKDIFLGKKIIIDLQIMSILAVILVSIITIYLIIRNQKSQD